MIQYEQNKLYMKVGTNMPYITVVGGQLTTEQKEKLIAKLTEVSSEIMNIPQDFFMISIKELSDKNIGIGGKCIDLVKEEYIRKNKKK